MYWGLVSKVFIIVHISNASTTSATTQKHPQVAQRNLRRLNVTHRLRKTHTKGGKVSDWVKYVSYLDAAQLCGIHGVSAAAPLPALSRTSPAPDRWGRLPRRAHRVCALRPVRGGETCHTCAPEFTLLMLRASGRSLVTIARLGKIFTPFDYNSKELLTLLRCISLTGKKYDL